MHNHTFATFLMLNNSYLPGALLLGYELRKQKVTVDLVCMITEHITGAASNIIVIKNVEKRSKKTITFLEFAKVGISLTVLNTLIFWIFLRFMP